MHVAVVGHRHAAQVIRDAGGQSEHFDAVPPLAAVRGADAVVISESAPQHGGVKRSEFVDGLEEAQVPVVLLETWGRYRGSFELADERVIPPGGDASQVLRVLGLPAGASGELVPDVPEASVRSEDDPQVGYKAVALWMTPHGRWQVSGPFSSWPGPFQNEAHCLNPAHADALETPAPEFGCVDGFSAYLERQAAQEWDSPTRWPVARLHLTGLVLCVGRPRSWTELNAQRLRVTDLELPACECRATATGLVRDEWDEEVEAYRMRVSCAQCAGDELVPLPKLPSS